MAPEEPKIAEPAVQAPVPAAAEWPCIACVASCGFCGPPGAEEEGEVTLQLPVAEAREVFAESEVLVDLECSPQPPAGTEQLPSTTSPRRGSPQASPRPLAASPPVGTITGAQRVAASPTGQQASTLASDEALARRLQAEAGLSPAGVSPQLIGSPNVDDDALARQLQAEADQDEALARQLQAEAAQGSPQGSPPRMHDFAEVAASPQSQGATLRPNEFNQPQQQAPAQVRMAANLPPPEYSEAYKVGAVQHCYLTRCCCLKVMDRDTVPEWMLEQTTTPAPSCYSRLCWCMCNPEDRHLSGLASVPQLRGLAGVTLQDGSHDTRGSLQTLKWSKWDAEHRILEHGVFGGFYNRGLGLWTEPTQSCCRSCIWACIVNLARNANYSYRFQFSEDFRQADIAVRGNLSALCCCCFPCMPSCTIPRWCCNHSMRQADDSMDGSHWIRYKGVCGKTPKQYYDLRTVFNMDGTPGPYFEYLPIHTPKQVQISR